MSRYAFGFLLVLFCAGSALADEIIFKNGDRISGTITDADAGKVSIDTPLAGPLHVPMDQIRTFDTDHPITLKLHDGNVVTDRIARDADGHISIGGTGTVRPQSVALADIKNINEPPPHWTGSITVGGTLTTGNSKTETFNAAFDAVRRGENDRITFDAGYFLANEKNNGGNRTTSTDNWFISGKYDYFFTKKFYAYGNAKFERDRIAHLDVRFTPGGGVGYQWVESPDFNFNTEGGLTWVYQRYTTGVTDDHVALRLAYHVDKAINDKVKVYHDLEYLPSLERIDTYNISSDIGLRTTLYKNLFAEIKAEWKYNSKPPNTVPPFGNGKTYKNDVRYMLNVGMTF